MALLLDAAGQAPMIEDAKYAVEAKSKTKLEVGLLNAADQVPLTQDALYAVGAKSDAKMAGIQDAANQVPLI